MTISALIRPAARTTALLSATLLTALTLPLAGAVPLADIELPTSSSQLLDPTVTYSGTYLSEWDLEGRATFAEGVNPAHFGGISGLEHVGGNRYLALSDDLAEHDQPRYYPITIDFNDRGEITSAHVEAPVYLAKEDVRDWEFNTVDPESLRLLPDGNLIWTSEGFVKEGVAPQITISGADGSFLRTLKLPEYHLPNDEGTRGVRHNQAYEGLALIDNGTKAVSNTEGPLAQDGPAATAEHGSDIRVTVYDVASGDAISEYVYHQDTTWPGLDARGTTEIFAVEDGLIFLERSYGETQTTAGLYFASFEEATNVLGKEALDGSETAMLKYQIADLSPEGEHRMNVESLTWGPDTPDGARSLIVGSDNNFKSTERGLLHTIAIERTEEPGYQRFLNQSSSR